MGQNNETKIWSVEEIATMNTATASGTGSTTHVDNSASDLIIGNHYSLPRGFDGEIALIALMKGVASTADQLWAAQRPRRRPAARLMGEPHAALS